MIIVLAVILFPPKCSVVLDERCNIDGYVLLLKGFRVTFTCNCHTDIDVYVIGVENFYITCIRNRTRGHEI